MSNPILTSGFGSRTLNGKPDYHHGVDYRARVPTPVVAMDGGTVLFVGEWIKPNGRPDGFGNRVIIDHGNGVISAYAHLSRMSVRAGAVVQQGERIATSGNTGASDSPHLHVETNMGGNIDQYRAGQIRYTGARPFDNWPYVRSGASYTDEIVLLQGDKLPAVRAFQERLEALGYDLGPRGADGEYGATTFAVVEQFQRDRNIPVDGKWGKDSRRELAEAERTQWRRPGAPAARQDATPRPASPPPQRTPVDPVVPRPDPRSSRPGGVDRPTSPPLLREGSTGAEVRAVQARLVALGYNLGTTGTAGNGVDGDFRGTTRQAVEAFQRDRGLPPGQQTGIVGPITRGQLDAAERSGWRAPAPSPPPDAPRSDTPRSGQTLETRGAFAAVSMGTIIRQSGPFSNSATLDSLTAVQSRQLVAATFGDGEGARVVSELGRRFGDEGTFSRRLMALALHEGGPGGPQIGRLNADPRGGFDTGTFQEGGLHIKTAAESAAQFAGRVSEGIAFYERTTSGRVDRSALTPGDRDLLAKVGSMAERERVLPRTKAGEDGREPAGRPAGYLFRAFADPTLSRAQIQDLASRRVQAGDAGIGRDVAEWTIAGGRSLYVNLDALAARAQESDATRRKPALPVLRSGIDGPATEALQRDLRALGYDLGQTGTRGDGVDGQFGESTERAVRAFQRDANAARPPGTRAITVDGQVGPSTWAALEARISPQISASVPPVERTTPPETPPVVPQPVVPQPTGTTRTLVEPDELVVRQFDDAVVGGTWNAGAARVLASGVGAEWVADSESRSDARLEVAFAGTLDPDAYRLTARPGSQMERVLQSAGSGAVLVRQGAANGKPQTYLLFDEAAVRSAGYTSVEAFERDATRDLSLEARVTETRETPTGSVPMSPAEARSVAAASEVAATYLTAIDNLLDQIVGPVVPDARATTTALRDLSRQNRPVSPADVQAVIDQVAGRSVRLDTNLPDRIAVALNGRAEQERAFPRVGVAVDTLRETAPVTRSPTTESPDRPSRSRTPEISQLTAMTY